MASGWFGGSGGADDAAATSEATPFEVAVAERTAEAIERAVRAQGETRPHRSARLRAQTAGQVAAVPVESGQRVERGEILIELARGDRGARLKEARARVSQRQLELEAAQRLSASGYQARVQVEEARAALEQAQAALAQIRQDIDYTTIEAPWAGTVDEVLVDAGDYLGVNGEAVTLVDNDPLRVVAHFQAVFDEEGISAEQAMNDGIYPMGFIRLTNNARERLQAPLEALLAEDMLRQREEGLRLGWNAFLHQPVTASPATK